MKAPLASSRTENLRGAAVMVLAMALFAIEDSLVKILTRSMPTGEVLIVLGFGGALVLAAIALMRGEGLPGRRVLHPAVLWRTAGEAVGTFGYVLALAIAPLALASVILQAMPLAVTMGAALFLGERVGWRRWLAIAFGFAGVVVTIAPWQAGFQVTALITLVGVVGLSLRDLATRRVPRRLSATHISIVAFLSLVPAGALLLVISGRGMILPDPRQIVLILGILAFGIAGYLAIVAATRQGDVGFIAPFRYTRIPFALVIAVLLFSERLSANLLIGAAMIAGSGLYAFWRESRRASPAPEAKL